MGHILLWTDSRRDALRSQLSLMPPNAVLVAAFSHSNRSIAAAIAAACTTLMRPSLSPIEILALIESTYFASTHL